VDAKLRQAYIEADLFDAELQIGGPSTPPRLVEQSEAIAGSKMLMQIPTDELRQLVFLGMGTLYVMVPSASWAAGELAGAQVELIVP